MIEQSTHITHNLFFICYLRANCGRNFKQKMNSYPSIENCILIRICNFYTTISKYNYKEFKDIHSYILNNFNVDNHVVAFARGITKEKDAKDIPIEYYEEYKKIIQKDWGKSGHVLQKATAAVRDLVMDEVNRELKENTHNFDCSAGKKFIEIYQDGKVATCEILETIVDKNWDTSLGKIQDYDYDINKLLKAQKAKEIIKYIKEKKCHCTFECPKHMDVLYNKKFYPKLLKKLMHYYI